MRLPVLGSLLLVSAVAACANPVLGTAVPKASAPATSTTSQQSGTSPAADLDPCDLLDAKGKAELGLSGAGEPQGLGSSRGCTWKLRGPRETLIFGAGIYDSLGVEDLPEQFDNRPLPKIDGREVVQTIQKGTTGCSVSLGITSTSRVTTTVVAGVDQAKACGLAYRMAQLIEPALG